MAPRPIDGGLTAHSADTPRVPLGQALPILLARLEVVAQALAGTGRAPPPPAGFPAVPDHPPNRRERALLVQFAWVAYTVLAGRPPAPQPPADWPWRLDDPAPLSTRRPDLLPALARMIDRILTAPPLAPLPSPAGLEELLRRAMPRDAAGRTPRHVPIAPPAGVVVEVDFAPAVRESAAVVVARLRLLAQVLATLRGESKLAQRRGVFRLGWSGWERLLGRAPYDTTTPYVLDLGAPPHRPTIPDVPPDAPAALTDLLARLLDRAEDAEVPAPAQVVRELAAIAGEHLPEIPEPAVKAPPAAVATGAVREASRLLDTLIDDGVVRHGAAAAIARSVEERLAVTGLAWSVYRALTGITPVFIDRELTAAYLPVATLAPDVSPALAAVVDATLAPEAPGQVPGVATWLAAAGQAQDEALGLGAVPTSDADDDASDDVIVADAEIIDVGDPASPVGERAPADVAVAPEPAPAASAHADAAGTIPLWPWIAVLVGLAIGWWRVGGP